MATITSNGTGGGRWSLGATWAGGIAPADNDTVVIAAGDVVDMDLDLTGWATGINGITINGHATTPGELRCYTGAPGKYGFKLKANTVIQGTNLTTKGIFRAGTDINNPLPENIVYEVIMGGTAANEMSQISGAHLNFKVFCNDPTIRYVQLTSAAIVGDTVLNVDQDVTADATRPWGANDVVVCCNAVKTGTRTSDVKSIASVTSTTITLSAGLTYALPQYSVIVLRTRNVRFLVNSNVSGSAKPLLNAPIDLAGSVFRAEMTNTLWVGGTGTYFATSGAVGLAYAAVLVGSAVARQFEIGGVVCALTGAAGGNRQMMLRQKIVHICADTPGDYWGSLNADVLFVGCNYTSTASYHGTVRVFCSGRGMERTWGRFDKNSRIEWCVTAIGSSGFAIFYDGVIANCTNIGGNAYTTFGTNSRLGAGVTNSYGGVLSARTVMYGTRFSMSPPYVNNAGFSDPDSYVHAYDWADSSDVPQYGQNRAWMGAGEMAPDATPASPPSGLVATFCNKMSHTYAGLELIAPPIAVTLEAGTPFEIDFFAILGSGAYSWTQKPRFELFDPGFAPNDPDGIVAIAVDANGDEIDETSVAWQTLYLRYLLPIAANRPLGAKQNFILRVRATVSNATGTPYWHWNYTQGAVVNANVQYVNGEPVTSLGGAPPFVTWGAMRPW